MKLALAIELGVRVVAAFPGTWRLARALLGAALLTTTAAVTLGGGPQQPLLASGAIDRHVAVDEGNLTLAKELLRSMTPRSSGCAVDSDRIGGGHAGLSCGLHA